MRLFLLMLYLLILESCTTVETTREIIKAGNSVKTTISEMIINKEDDSKIHERKIIESKTEVEIEVKTEAKIEAGIEEKIEIITTEQKEQKNIIETQQEASQINFLGNSLNEIKKILGEPKLAREDGNIFMLRYDSINCRLFLFFNHRVKNKQVKYFELRNINGVLFESRKSIEVCYKEFKLV